ncbi:MAG: hypothetical protein ABWK05_08445 [Pyrobaculum sp.]
MRRILQLLLVTAALFANPTVTCEKVGNFTWSSSAVVPVSFEFGALAPLGLGDGLVSVFDTSKLPLVVIWDAKFINTSRLAVASSARSWEWDRDLAYSITLKFFNPDEKWEVERYRCVWTYTYRRGDQTITIKDIRFYNLVVGEPSMVETTVKFVVPRRWSSYVYRDAMWVGVGRSIAEGSWDDLGLWTLCSRLPTADTWPYCGEEYRRLNVVVSGSSPQLWKALRISGVEEGQVVTNGYVNATVPKPWYYTDYGIYNGLSLNTALVVTDRSPDPVYIKEVREKPFSTRVGLNVEAVPSKWGVVEVRPPPPVPLYLSRVVLYKDLGQCKTPDCFVIDEVGNSTWVGDRWVWNGTLASVALRTPFNLNPVAAMRVADVQAASAHGVAATVPYGSVLGIEASVLWHTTIRGQDTWINSFPTARLSVVDKDGNDLSDQYESAAAAGKLWYKMTPGSLYSYGAPGVKWEGFYAAIDASRPRVVTAWYAPPDPCHQWPTQAVNCVYSQNVFTKVNGTWTGYAKIGPRGGVQRRITKLELVDWLMPHALLHRNSTDILAYLGYPYLLTWHNYKLSTWAFNPETGDFDVPDQVVIQWPHRSTLLSLALGYSLYRNTTNVRGMPYYQISALPEWYYNYAFEGVNGDELPAGWADVLPLGFSSMATNSTAPWAVYLVPTTACPSLICPRLSPVLWGPAPGPTADLALPGAGYSFLVVYLGRGNATTIRLYVDAGYVVREAGGSVEYWFGRDIFLVEVSRNWRFLDGVYAGPGWYLDYKPLAPCESAPASGKSVYVTPTNYTGPLRLTIEEVETGRRYYFIFFVSAEAQLFISSTSTAPEALVAPQLNVTASLYLNGVPYFHGLPAFGEGGRQYVFKCAPAEAKARSYLGAVGAASQLFVTGEFRGELDVFTSTSIQYYTAKLAFVYLDKNTVKIGPEDPDAPVVGYAFYLMRNGTWRKVAEVDAPCVVANVTLAMPWDPVLVLPVVRQYTWARQGDVVLLWRPGPRLLFKAWAEEPWLAYTQFNQTYVRPCSR